MTLTLQEKNKIIHKHAQHEGDTGSAPVQIALFTKEIQRLTNHLKTHPKDNHSRTGILKMVSKRKRLLEYLKERSPQVYDTVVKDLGLRSSYKR